MSSAKQLNYLQRRANHADKLSKQLERTINQLKHVQTSQSSQIQQGYLTRNQTEGLLNKFKNIRSTVVNLETKCSKQTEIINQLKGTFKDELLSIKQDLLLPSAKSCPQDFRDGIKSYLLKIKQEIERYPQNESNDSIPREVIRPLLTEMKLIRDEFSKKLELISNVEKREKELCIKEKEFYNYKNHIKTKTMKLRQEVVSMETSYKELMHDNRMLQKKLRIIEHKNNQFEKGDCIPTSLKTSLKNELSRIRDECYRIQIENETLRLENLNTNKDFLSEIDHTLYVSCIDMHTGGEPLRIIEKGIPLDIHLSNKKNITLLDKREYMIKNLDYFRKFLMFEPRGHKDMYGVLITNSDNQKLADFGVLFMHNEGYSSMCGHAVIALARYAIDSGLVNTDKNIYKNGISEEKKDNTENNNNIRKVNIQVPCGIVECMVNVNEKGKSTGKVSFLSAPGWAEYLDQTIEIEKYGKITYDIGYGGAYYAIVSASKFNVSVTKSSIDELIFIGNLMSENVKKKLLNESNNFVLTNPFGKSLEFLYGTILIDDNNDKSNNITIFADKQVDRCPTGSGVIARLSVDNAKKIVNINEKKLYIGPTGSVFEGIIKENNFDYKTKKNCVRVQVTGDAYYVGKSTFYLENHDQLGNGFLLK